MGEKGIGEIGKTYCKQRAQDIVFGRDTSQKFTTYSIQRGLELEPIAFDFFAERNFFELYPAEFYFYNDNSGAIPDATTSNNGCVEIKCPGNEKVLDLIIDEKIPKEHICQMEMEMMSTGFDHCHYFNFGIRNGEYIFHEIIVKEDKIRQELIAERIDQAVKIRDQYVQELLNNKQF